MTNSLSSVPPQMASRQRSSRSKKASEPELPMATQPPPLSSSITVSRPRPTIKSRAPMAPSSEKDQLVAEYAALYDKVEIWKDEVVQAVDKPGIKRAGGALDSGLVRDMDPFRNETDNLFL